MKPINHQSAVESEHKASSAKPIKIKASKEGSLHTAMGVSQSKKISTGSERKKLVAAKKSGDVSLERKLVFAMNAKKFKH